MDEKALEVLDEKALEVSKRLLLGHVNFMFEEGDIDNLFYRYHSPRSKQNANQLVEMIERYCVEVKQEISKLESYKKLPKIDFINACKMARSIKAKSVRIGAKNVTTACVFVVEACLAFNEEGFAEAVVDLSNEFRRTKTRFETYLEMGREISEKEKKFKKPNK